MSLRFHRRFRFNDQSAYTVSGGGGGSYTGPGDVAVSQSFTWKAWYGIRAFSAATAGTKAYRVKRASDNAETDINSLASGLPDVATVTTFLNATTGTIVKWYDQSGANAFAGSTNGDTSFVSVAPACTLSGLNGWPVATSSGGQALRSDNTLTLSQPFTLVALYKTTVDLTSQRVLANRTGSSLFLGPSAAANARSFAGSSITQTAANNTFLAVIAPIANGGLDVVVVNGSAGSAGSAGAATFNSNVQLFSDDSLGFTGSIAEGGIIGSALNSTQYAALNSNMHDASSGWNF